MPSTLNGYTHRNKSKRTWQFGSVFFFFFFSKQNVVYFNIWMYIFNNKSVNIINIETVGESDIKMPSIDKTLV